MALLLKEKSAIGLGCLSATVSTAEILPTLINIVCRCQWVQIRILPTRIDP
jgi:hypothetical protein